MSSTKIVGEIPGDETNALFYSPQKIQWWNILLIVIGIIIIFLLVAVLRVAWTVREQFVPEIAKDQKKLDKEFGLNLARAKMGESAVNQFIE